MKCKMPAIFRSGKKETYSLAPYFQLRCIMRMCFCDQQSQQPTFLVNIILLYSVMMVGVDWNYIVDGWKSQNPPVPDLNFENAEMFSLPFNLSNYVAFKIDSNENSNIFRKSFNWNKNMKNKKNLDQIKNSLKCILLN